MVFFMPFWKTFHPCNNKDFIIAGFSGTPARWDNRIVDYIYG